MTDTDETSDQATDVTNDELLSDNDIVSEPLAITPGEGIGAVKVGMTYAEVKAAIGTTEDVMIYNRLAIVTYPELALEMLFTSPEDFTLVDSGRLIAVGAKTDGQFDFAVTHGMTKEAALAAIDESGEDVGKRIYFPSGFSLEFDDAELVSLIGVFKPYVPKLEPPEMEPCASTKPALR
ncbi:MAG TPA: hypothetical protein PLV42_03845 [bacterium]|nr:hypothetical protein [bacterium]